MREGRYVLLRDGAVPDGRGWEAARPRSLARPQRPGRGEQEARLGGRRRAVGSVRGQGLFFPTAAELAVETDLEFEARVKRVVAAGLPPKGPTPKEIKDAPVP